MTNAAVLRLSHSLRHRLITNRHYLTSTLHSPLKGPHLGHVLPSHDVTYGRLDQFKRFDSSQLSHYTWETRFSSCRSFCSGQGNNIDFDDEEKAHSTTTMGPPVIQRKLTNMLLAINVLVYFAQGITDGDLTKWGQLVSSLINKGELWRLVTSNFLHANVLHLMLNSSALNWIGPIVEHVSGPIRFLTIYMTSAITCSIMSCWFIQGPSVGASGAIFGLVGSYVVYLIRHHNKEADAVGELFGVAFMIALNLGIGFGLLSNFIDNWGHVGGLIGGIVTSWLIGPAWKLKNFSYSKRVYVDKAPILYLPGTKPKTKLSDFSKGLWPPQQ